MSVKKREADEDDNNDDSNKIDGEEPIGKKAKRQRFNRCLPFMEIHMEGVGSGRGPPTSLKNVDPKKFKAEIKRWAKRVVVYARQVSARIGSGRRSSRSSSSSHGGSSRRSAQDDERKLET